MKETIKVPRELLASFLTSVEKLCENIKEGDIPTAFNRLNCLKKSSDIREIIKTQDKIQQLSQKFKQLPLL